MTPQKMLNRGWVVLLLLEKATKLLFYPGETTHCYVLLSFPFALFNGGELNPSLHVKVVMASLVNFQSNYGMPFVMLKYV